MSNYMIAHFDEIDKIDCPCGFSRRAFAVAENTTATVHLVDIRSSARTHYHRKMTEIYVVLEGEGYIELDGEKVPVQPMTCVFIKPGCRHKAVGKLKILNFVMPPFDPGDEWFD